MRGALLLALLVFFVVDTGDLLGQTPSPTPATMLSISGTLWEDKNADGMRQADEPGLLLVPLQLGRVDGSGNPVFTDDRGIELLRDTNGRSVRTDASGAYTFTNLASGSYVLRLTPLGGGNIYFWTYPARRGTGEFGLALLLEASVANLDFGLHRPRGLPGFSGQAWIDGARVPRPDVRAIIVGIDCTTGPSVIPPPGLADFTISVVSNALIPGCGETGKTVRFTVNGLLANESAKWGESQPPTNPTEETRGRFRLTVGPPFAVFSVTAEDAEGLIDVVAPGSVEALVDGRVCARNEPFGGGGSRIILKSRELGGCGYDGALVTFVKDGATIGETIWMPGEHEVPRIGPDLRSSNRSIRAPSVGDGGLLGLASRKPSR